MIKRFKPIGRHSMALIDEDNPYDHEDCWVPYRDYASLEKKYDKAIGTIHAIKTRYETGDKWRAEDLSRQLAERDAAFREILSLEEKGASAHGKWGDAYRIARAALAKEVQHD